MERLDARLASLADATNPHLNQAERTSTAQKTISTKADTKLYYRRTAFIAAEAEANEDMIRIISRLIGSKPTEAQVTRALWSILRASEETFMSRSPAHSPQLHRPQNGFSIENAEYERELAVFLLSGLS